jgi:hypothetical protein
MSSLLTTLLMGSSGLAEPSGHPHGIAQTVAPFEPTQPGTPRYSDPAEIADMLPPVVTGNPPEHAVSLDEATRLAFIKAHHLWGPTLELRSVLEVCDPKGTVYAYDFDFALPGNDHHGYADVARAALRARLDRLATPRDVSLEKGQHGSSVVSPEQPAQGRCYVVVSATLDAPPIRASGPVPSAFYTTGWIARLRVVEEHDGAEPALMRVYFLDPYHRWFEFECAGARYVVAGRPPFQVLERDEFLMHVLEEDPMKQAPQGTKDPQALEEHLRQTREKHRRQIGELLNHGLGTSAWTMINYWQVLRPFDWSYGCTPTSAAMMLNFWDLTDWFGRLNYRYYQRWDNLEGEYDYQVATLQSDLAIYMGTDPSGGTHRDNVGPGMREYVLLRGYSFMHIFCRYEVIGGNMASSEDWCWDSITEEIGAGRPFVWSTTFGWGGAGHSCCAVGYDGGAQDVVVYNTWDGSLHAYHHAGSVNTFCQIDGGYPGNPVYFDAKLTAPQGDTWYNHDGWGEQWRVGEPHAITWDNFGNPGTALEIFYHLYGGENPAQYVWIVTTADDSSYTWVPPCDAVSDQARIVIQQFNGGTFVSSDGSIGNFILDAAAPPEAPTNCVATDTLCGVVHIEWDIGLGEDRLGFNVYRDGLKIGVVPPTSSAYDDLTGQTCVQYSYCVAAYNGCLESSSACDNGTALAAPDPPTTCAATDDNPNWVRITWQDNSSGACSETGFAIHRDGGLIATVGPNVTVYDDVAAVAWDSSLYCVTAYNNCDSSAACCTTGVRIGGLPGVRDREETPRVYFLAQNQPNPFGVRTAISFDVPRDGRVRIMIYDVKGRVVRNLVDGFRSAGSYSVTWEGLDEAGKPQGAGIYFVRMEAAGFLATRKVNLLR